MVNDFFKQYELTNNSNFIGDCDTPKAVYKVHVRGRKDVIVQLINDIINVHSHDQITPEDNEMKIVSTLDVSNTFNKTLPHVEVQETSDDNNVHFDRYREVDDNCLLSFYVGELPKRQWGLVVEHYSSTEWIIDEYRENWYPDESSVEYKFRHSYISQNAGQIPLKSTYSTNVMDFLLEKYPVHFGCVRLEQLRKEQVKLCAKQVKYERTIKTDSFKQMHPEIQKTLMSVYLITQRDLLKVEHEIDFIKYLWGELNENLYGNEDPDLAMRFRGIDTFSPISDIDLAFVEEE